MDPAVPLYVLLFTPGYGMLSVDLPLTGDPVMNGNPGLDAAGDLSFALRSGALCGSVSAFLPGSICIRPGT